jgi:hypothetical protein
MEFINVDIFSMLSGLNSSLTFHRLKSGVPEVPRAVQGRAVNLPNAVLYFEPYIIGSFPSVVGWREENTRQGEMPIRIQKR